MGKKDVKRKHKDLDISVIDYIAKLDPTKTNKMTSFLVDRFKEKYNRKPSTNRWMRDHFNPQTQFETVMGEVLVDSLGGRDNIESLIEFSSHLEAGRIDKNDITTYKSWTDINRSLASAQMKFMDKEMKKQTKVIYEDETWLILKPLSVKASQTYGMGTKWCTAMKHQESYFYDYSRRGILIYTINKTNGKKFGFYSSSDEFSVWDARDKRVDSMETRLPVQLIELVRTETDIDTIPFNKELFGEEANKQYDDYYSGDKKVSVTLGLTGNLPEDEEMVMEAPIMEMGDVMTTEAEMPMFANVGYADEGSEELVEPNGEDWEPRGADVAFGNMVAHAGIAVEMGDTEIIDEVMEDMTMDDVMEVPANTPFIIRNEGTLVESDESVEHGTEEG
jgi:hypothetical protein